jgi:glycosyltransferase involved in cell wall biosynthesis
MDALGGSRMSRPIVSVLVTAYNRETYIAASIESVLAQTFGDFEVIITDNQSTDGTLEIARQYERLDPRVRVVLNERNLGQFGNRNRAASLAVGEFLKFHDSDDLLYPHCLAIMTPLLVAEPRAGFGLSNSRYWPGGPAPMLLTPRESFRREFLGHGLFMCGPAGAMFRADAFRALGGFEDHGAPSDTIFWMRACARFPALLFPADLFFYREHPGQEFQSVGVARQYAILSEYAWRALASPDCPLDPDELDRARKNVAFGTAKTVWRALQAGDLSLARHRISRSGISPLEWVRYLRRPRRSAFAGTPLGPDGEFVIPAWCRSVPDAREPR